MFIVELAGDSVGASGLLSAIWKCRIIVCKGCFSHLSPIDISSTYSVRLKR
uniref:Uncharacterized protein n=1 Tax=Thermosporothrix sp. COM3 TaxID=2490863 RepID=A0A455SRX7_9CHLR|nr:hypothetical protein KTC_45600 [Thermosporothrix sp. COM3]